MLWPTKHHAVPSHTAQVRATGMIAQLFRKTENFEALLQHDTLVQMLSRIMREEMKKSIDLCINVVSVFFSISNFSQFHGLIMDNQVGAWQLHGSCMVAARGGERRGRSSGVLIMDNQVGAHQYVDDGRLLSTSLAGTISPKASAGSREQSWRPADNSRGGKPPSVHAVSSVCMRACSSWTTRWACGWVYASALHTVGIALLLHALC
jgi:hypothetical protein